MTLNFDIIATQIQAAHTYTLTDMLTEHTSFHKLIKK